MPLAVLEKDEAEKRKYLKGLQPEESKVSKELID